MNPIRRMQQTQATRQWAEQAHAEDIFDVVREHIAAHFDNRIQIVGIAIVGSYTKGTATTQSDLDIVVEYTGDIREDDAYNALNENRPEYIGVEIDINPIKAEKSGTLREWLANHSYNTDDIPSTL